MKRKERPEMRKGFNKYVIVDDYAVIYLDRKDGSTIEAIVDASDIPMLKELNECWHARWSHYRSNYYVYATHYFRVNNEDKKRQRNITLHRTLLGLEDEKLHIDHINHNTLDNRRSNLRVLPCDLNSRYRKSKNRNNKSGYRNVFFNSTTEKWDVVICKHYKQMRIGSFDDVHEAGRIAEQTRQKMFGEFAGLD